MRFRRSSLRYFCRVNAPLTSFENYLPRRVIAGRGAGESLTAVAYVIAGLKMLFTPGYARAHPLST